MKIYFSASARGFYFDEIHGDNKPSDCKEIPKSLWENILFKQSQGQEISSDADGKPITINPIDNISIDEVRDLRKKFINSERDRVLSEGFVFEDILFDCDLQASVNLSATVSAVNAGIALPGNFTWRSKENLNIPMTASKVVEFGASMLAYINSVYDRSWRLKDLIDQRNSKSSINKIDWNTEV